MPVTLTQVAYQPPDGVPRLPVWNAKQNVRDRAHLMPILTPTYPSMNSAYNVGIPQLRRIVHCLKRAAGIVKDIEVSSSAEGSSWADLYRGEHEFFHQRHAHFLQINTLSSNQDYFLKWFRFVESRLRLLIAGLENPDYGVQAEPYCQFYHAPPSRQSQQNNATTTARSCSFFIALRFAGTTVDVAPLVREFLYKIHARRLEGCHVCLELKTRHDLPPELLQVPPLLGNTTTKSSGATARETTGVVTGKQGNQAVDATTTTTSAAEQQQQGQPAATTTGTEVSSKEQQQQQQPISWAMKVRGAMASPAKRART